MFKNERKQRKATYPGNIKLVLSFYNPPEMIIAGGPDGKPLIVDDEYVVKDMEIHIDGSFQVLDEDGAELEVLPFSEIDAFTKKAARDLYDHFYGEIANENPHLKGKEKAPKKVFNVPKPRKHRKPKTGGTA